MKCGCGTSRVTLPSMVLGAVAAALLGAVGAVVGAGFPDHWGVRETSENLLKEASVRGLMMVLAGSGAGLVFGSTIKSRVTSVVFGVVGGALAAGLCPILISTLFPDVRSEQFLVSNLPVNLCLLGTTGLLIGLFTSIARSQPQ